MNTLKRFSSIAHWLPRISLATTFLYHGLGKFPMAEMMAKGMGMPLPMIYILATMEVMGAILILYGGLGNEWATQVAGIVFTLIMIGAIFMVHLENGWSFMSGWGDGTNNMGGAEFQTLIAVMGLYFALKGNSVNDPAV